MSGQETVYPTQPVKPAATEPAAAPAQPPASRELSPEDQKFMDALTWLFTSAQEFGLSLATIETDISTLPRDVREALELGREVAKAVKNFQQIVKERMKIARAARPATTIATL